MNFEERAISFTCNGSSLMGILGVPEQASPRGVVIVVGGPQYRAGSHRQFVLLARYLAEQGIPSIRFDYRGMGDSEGTPRTFEEIDDDLRCAINVFFTNAPELREIVIWGLCDAASSAALYAHTDTRVRGLVLLNPWVRTEGGLARAYLKHYYRRRLFERDLWGNIVCGRFNYASAARSLATVAAKVLQRARNEPAPMPGTTDGERGSSVPLPDRMLISLERFDGPLLLILSGNDLTAQEFSDTVGSSRKWRGITASARTIRRTLPQANHTFSKKDWREQVASWTVEWIQSW
jgi:exosortase A-associated hydrolase 1